MTWLILIPLMAFFARACGASWKPLGAELMFAAPFAIAVLVSTESYWAAATTLAWVYFAMQLGHGNAFHMGQEPNRPDRFQTLDRLVRPITNWLGFAPRSAGYCWVFMGVKGLLIGAPLFPYGMALAVLWPLAYWISWRIWKGTLAGEWISGAFAGAILWVSL